jgi:hypothetical protein
LLYFTDAEYQTVCLVDDGAGRELYDFQLQLRINLRVEKQCIFNIWNAKGKGKVVPALN